MRLVLVAAVLVALAGAGVAAYMMWFRVRLPQPGSPEYDHYLDAFYVGTAMVDSDRKEVALARLDKAIELVPHEPAAWANRGLVYLRDNDKASAARDLKRAAQLAPDSTEIEALLGHLARAQGDFTAAAKHFRKVVEKNPRDLESIYTLAEIVSQEGKADSEVEYQKLMERILEVQPNNLHVLVKRASAAFQNKDRKAFDDTLQRFDLLQEGWTQKSSSSSSAGLAREKLAELHRARDEEISDLLMRFNNVLQSERGYAVGTGALKPKDAQIGNPVQHFLRMQPPRPTPAPPDMALSFGVAAWMPPQAVPGLDKVHWDAMQILWRVQRDQLNNVVGASSQGGLSSSPARAFEATIVLANSKEVRLADPKAPALPFPGGAKGVAPSAAAIVPFDWDNDLRMDLVVAGAGGLKFFHHEADGSFADVTAKVGLRTEVLTGDYFGAWPADFEMDGDLDLMVARRQGPPLLLRNNGDGTFKAVEVKDFAGVRDVRSFVWADLDNDGACDAVFVDGAGKLHVFFNERGGLFTASPLPGDVGSVVAVTAADVNDDGIFDIVALRKDGTLIRISDQDHRHGWQVEALASATVPADAAPGNVTLLAEDFDNNGAIDLLIAGPRAAQLFLADEAFRFKVVSAEIPFRVCGVIESDDHGRLDLIGLSAEGQPMRGMSVARKQYHHQTMRPIGNVKWTGDDRINSFAVGGEVEARAGLLVQKQRITGPLVHFGLGENKTVAVVRIVWPNGIGQREFELPLDPLLLAAQRINTSCPFLFTDDGSGMRFVGDFMWNTPLGMYVNGQVMNSFDPAQTTEWLKIRGEHLKPRDGYYDIRVHANLWETDYFDQLGLIVVDHPADTEIYADERFFLTPTPPTLYVTTPARPVARAWDHLGKDCTDIVSAIDGRYLDRAGRGKYQGITNDHWVEAELPDDAPTEGPVYLIARGWLHPTDSSINVAISQGSLVKPMPLVLEVPDGKGGWKATGPPLGFPAGKDKTCVIRLDGNAASGLGVPRRFRLRTNMEIFWDYLGFARGLDASLAKLHRPEPASAELRYRGILFMSQKDASSPEVPHYDKVTKGIQPWRDLSGYYTRYGDVRELVAKVDDRYVIANAGDEIAFRFPAPADPPAGWKRDFIWECDGWTRDGNPNTQFGTTVLPLPAHGIKSLDHRPGRLEDDPVFRRFPSDWTTYHTRYVTPEQFERGLRTFRK